MSKPVHYSPNGQRPFCMQIGPLDLSREMFMREARRSSTDLRKVTCPKCLHLMAGMMIRKGVPVQFKHEGKSFYERLLAVPQPRDGEVPVEGGAA